MIPKIAGWKKNRVSELTEIFNRNGSFGVIDVAGVPASNMISMRTDLRDRMTITMAKKSLIRLAWSESGKPPEELEKLLEGADQPCVVHSDDMNAFEIFNELSKTRQGRAAKAGEKFPEDVIIPAGPTEFGPGPIVGEFNAVGIPAKIDKGKVAIQRETTFNKGDEISADLGIMLAKLGINPIEIGLILTGVVEDGYVFEASDLDLDVEGLTSDIIMGVSSTFNLACNIKWFSPITLPTLISKASGESLSVAMEAGIINEKTASLLLSRVNSRALALASQLDSSALDEEIVASLGATSESASAQTSVEAESKQESEGDSEEEEAEEEESGGFDGLGELFG